MPVAIGPCPGVDSQESGSSVGADPGILWTPSPCEDSTVLVAALAPHQMERRSVKQLLYSRQVHGHGRCSPGGRRPHWTRPPCASGPATAKAETRADRSARAGGCKVQLRLIASQSLTVRSLGA
jgi:hypothetical protein